MKHALLVLLLAGSQDGEPSVVARLKSEGWTAARAIVARGAPGRASLAEASCSSDADVAFYAKAALGELEGTPLRRTKGIAGPATSAIKALFAMIDLPFAGDDLPDQQLTIPDGLTFIEALEWAGAKLDLEFTAGGTSARASKGPRFAFGRIRAQLDGLRHTTTYPLDQPAVGTVRLSGAIRADPTIRLVPCRAAITLIEAVDDGGANLKEAAPGVEGLLRLGGAPSDPPVPFSITISGYGANATKISRLRFSTVVTIEKKKETFTFTKILDAKGARKTLGLVTATIKETGMHDDEAAIDLEVAAAAEIVFPDVETIQLSDARGGLYASGGSSSGNGRTTHYRLRFQNVGELGPPDALTFTITTETERRTVYLEFRDIPLN